MMHTDLDKSIAIGKILMDRASKGPEFIRPEGIDEKQYAIWLTIVCALDYLKDADTLWSCARRALEHSYLKNIFNLDWLEQVPEDALATDLYVSGLSIFNNKDAKVLKKIAELLNKWYNGDPREILKAGMYDGAEILELLDEFPHLRGKKLRLFWLRLMHDLIEPKLNIFGTSIPVDVHVARLTLRTGCISFYEDYSGTIEKIMERIQVCWDLTAMALKTYPSKFDEPLWSISKYICPRCPEKCPIEKHCDKRDVNVTSQKIEVPKNDKIGNKP